MRRGLAFRVVIGSALLALIVGGAFVLLLRTIEDLRDSGQEAVDTREELAAEDRLQKTIIDLETGQRGFIITGKERFLEPWEAGRRAFPKQAAELIELADTPEGKARAQRIAEDGTSYIEDYSAPLVQAARRGDPSARSVAATQEGKDRVDELRDEFDVVIEADREALTARQEAADDDAQRAVTVAVAGLAVSIVLIVLAGFDALRSITLPVRRTSEMAGRLAGGDLGVRLPETGAGEIRDLERSFNSMADSLEESQTELRDSRSRVVAAADETRRRLERDIHDGVQQSLVHTLIALKLAKREMADDDGEAATLVNDALGHGERANQELRELAHGILPAVLARGGLRAGVEALLSRIPLEVSMDVTDERFQPALEATAYFITAEALTNVVKHSGAGRAEVKASRHDGVLRLEVSDDGHGGARVSGEGSGLLGLQDRAGAVGGVLRVESPPGQGTVLRAELPLPGPGGGSGSIASQ